MKRNKYAKVMTLVFITIFILAGCWDYREIEDMVIVAGMAIDTGSRNNYLVTIETIELEQSPGAGVQPKSKVMSVEGLNIFDAGRNVIKISPQQLYWSHAKVIIISEEVAREGIVKVLDFVMRAREPRITMNILIAKEKNASDLLPQDTLLDEIYSFQIEEMLKAQEHLSKAPYNEVYEVIDLLMAKGISTVIPTIGLSIIEDKKTPEISGLAMFKKDKLVGFLDEEEARTFLFITNKIKGGILVKPYPSESSPSHIGLDILENKTKIQSKYENEKLTMEVKINTKATLQDWEMVNYNNMSTESINHVEKQFEEYLRKDIENLIKKVQNEYQCDIFGFGQNLMNQNPRLWKEFKEDWENIFATLEVEVDTNIDIINISYMERTIEVGD